jgi:hypothetical protein
VPAQQHRHLGPRRLAARQGGLRRELARQPGPFPLESQVPDRQAGPQTRALPLQVPVSPLLAVRPSHRTPAQHLVEKRQPPAAELPAPCPGPPRRLARWAQVQ